MKRFTFLSSLVIAGFLSSCGGGDGIFSALFGDRGLRPQQTCTVTVNSVSALQTALTNAQSNNTDDVICIEAGTYTVTQTLSHETPNGDNGHKLTIKAIGGRVVLDGGNSVQIMRIVTNSYPDLEDTGGDVNIEGITFQNGNNSAGDGGGLYIQTRRANINLTNNIFNNNQAQNDGGGVYADSTLGNISIRHNTFSNNRANRGGGVAVRSWTGSVTFADNTFDTNNARDNGGGLYGFSPYGAVSLNNNTFNNNSASWYGGGAYAESKYATLANNSFNNNTANWSGGGAYARSDADTVTLSGNTFTGNSSRDGGGVYAIASNINFTNNTFNNNNASSSGGGSYIRMFSGSTTLTDNTFSNNTSFFGGGLYVASSPSTSSSLAIVRNTFNSNKSDGGGGAGLHLEAGSAFVASNEFIGNQGSAGGGLAVSSNSAYVVIIGNTFRGNRRPDDATFTATAGGGLNVYSQSGSIAIVSNVFVDNRADALGSGGGLRARLDSGSIEIVNNLFQNNIAYPYDGGGVYVISYYGHIKLSENTFTGNSADRDGGGAYLRGIFQGSSIILTNNVFNGNIATNGGGIYAHLDNNNVTITSVNNTFRNNTAHSFGGGAYVDTYADEIIVKFYNNIFWQNMATSGDGDDLYVDSDGNNNQTSSTVNLYNNNFSGDANFQTGQSEDLFITLVQPGRYNHNGNIQADPLFVDASNGNFRLQPSSPCVNAGNNSAPSLPLYDKDVNQRIAGTRVDIGAYEYGSNPILLDLSVTILGTGAGSVSSSPPGINCTSGTCAQSYNALTLVILNASPNTGSTFAGWSGNTCPCRDLRVTTCYVLMDSNKACNATFNSLGLGPYTITTSANPSDGGSVTCTPNPVPRESRSTCSIVVNPGYRLEDVSGTCGGTLSGTTYTTNPITNDCTVVANFVREYRLEVSKTGNGSGDVISYPEGIDCGQTCSANFDEDTWVILTATPDQGSVFAGWGGDCASCGSDPECLVIMSSNKTCIVTFNAAAEGPITDTRTGQSPSGGQITLTVTGGTITDFSIVTNLTNIPENGIAPYGGVSFTVQLAQGQNSITVSVTYPSIPQGAKFYKLRGGQYTDITGQVQISGNTITLTIVDNSSLDGNPQSGVISDPIVLVVPQQQGGQQPPAQPPQGGGGGGCSMSYGGSPFNAIAWLLPPLLVMARRIRKSL